MYSWTAQELIEFFRILLNPLDPRMIRIFADFNALDGDKLPLIFKGSVEDITRQNVDLREGLLIIVYDDGYEAEAMLEKVRGEWYAKVVAGTGRRTV